MDVDGIVLLARRTDNGSGYERVGVGGYVRTAHKHGASPPRLYRIVRTESTGGTGPGAMRVTLENAQGRLAEKGDSWVHEVLKRTPTALRDEFVFVRAAVVESAPEVVQADELERLAS